MGVAETDVSIQEKVLSSLSLRQLISLSPIG